MKMTNYDKQLETFTVEEFQEDFDNLLERVQSGESFIIKSEYGSVIMIPYQEIVKVFEDTGVDDELIRLHTDHEEGS